ncbi:MAG: UbiX family flavin prenyltransferase [Proteobacteria bacterium]|nr:UbiX family flavin prenyltransferase [Pseudomonadota bacterium]
MNEKEITLAFSGASGAAYGLRLLEQLLLEDYKIHLVFSTAGLMVVNDETSLKLSGNVQKINELLSEQYKAKPNQLTVYGKDDWYSKLASGSSAPKTMVVCPCSVGCLAAIALGSSDNLLERAADVVIKEQGKLVLVVREMPLSAIHLEHMLKLARLGVCVMPASPGFYFNPQSVDEIVDFVVARILENIGVTPKIGKKWGEKA